MKTLLALSVLALSLPAAAQTSGSVSAYAGGRFAVVASENKAVRRVVAIDGYLLDKADLDKTNFIEGGDGFEIRPDGLFLDGSVHGPSLTDSWTTARALSDLEAAVRVAEKDHKKKGADELSARCEALRKRLQALATERSTDEARILLDTIELRALKSKTAFELASASRDVDLFAAALPK